MRKGCLCSVKKGAISLFLRRSLRFVICGKKREAFCIVWCGVVLFGVCVSECSVRISCRGVERMVKVLFNRITRILLLYNRRGICWCLVGEIKGFCGLDFVKSILQNEFLCIFKC